MKLSILIFNVSLVERTCRICLVLKSCLFAGDCVKFYVGLFVPISSDVFQLKVRGRWRLSHVDFFLIVLQVSFALPLRTSTIILLIRLWTLAFLLTPFFLRVVRLLLLRRVRVLREVSSVSVRDP